MLAKYLVPVFYIAGLAVDSFAGRYTRVHNSMNLEHSFSVSMTGPRAYNDFKQYALGPRPRPPLGGPVRCGRVPILSP